MKIMIVDTNVEEKYFDIIKELERRNYEILIVQAANTAMCEIIMDTQETIAGIILGMNIPVKKEDEIPHERGGEQFLIRMSREEIINIPVLMYSKTETQSHYVQVFDWLRDWNKDQKNFFDFLETIQERQR